MLINALAEVDAHQFSVLAEAAHQSHVQGDDEQTSRLAGRSRVVARRRTVRPSRGAICFEAATARWAMKRLELIEVAVEAEMRSGRADSVVSELEALVTRHPCREPLWERLALALYRSGRQANALDRLRI